MTIDAQQKLIALNVLKIGNVFNMHVRSNEFSQLSEIENMQEEKEKTTNLCDYVVNIVIIDLNKHKTITF